MICRSHRLQGDDCSCAQMRPHCKSHHPSPAKSGRDAPLMGEGHTNRVESRRGDPETYEDASFAKSGTASPTRATGLLSRGKRAAIDDPEIAAKPEKHQTEMQQKHGSQADAAGGSSGKGSSSGVQLRPEVSVQPLFRRATVASRLHLQRCDQRSIAIDESSRAHTQHTSESGSDDTHGETTQRHLRHQSWAVGEQSIRWDSSIRTQEHPARSRGSRWCDDPHGDRDRRRTKKEGENTASGKVRSRPRPESTPAVQRHSPEQPPAGVRGACPVRSNASACSSWSRLLRSMGEGDRVSVTANSGHHVRRHMITGMSPRWFRAALSGKNRRQAKCGRSWIHAAR